MKNFLGIIVAVMLWSGLFAQEKPSVVVTTYPLYEVMHRVGGDTIKLKKILPFGSDVHIFRLTPKHIVTARNADVFVYSGAGLEPWGEQLLTNLDAGTKAVDMSRHVTLLHYDAGKTACGHDHHHEHDTNGMTVDPHYWLDVGNMITMTDEAVALLSDLQPQFSETYRKNALAFKDELQALNRDYADTLQECKQQYLVSNHDAFGYLAHAYGFKTAAVTGLSPDQQPSAKVMAEVMKLVKEKGVDTVFFEAFVSNSVARSLARETGTAVESLQPLANLSADEAASNENYITIMRKNLKKIAKVLECR